jgi:hypothetical protein
MQRQFSGNGRLLIRDVVVDMVQYSERTKAHMRAFFESLSEKDRRRYAAVESEKLGHGGTEYIASLFECDPNTIRQGKQDVEELPWDAADGRVRKKGGA